MKINMRIGCFETNSSSVHTLTIVSEDDFNKWKSGEFIYDNIEDELITIEESKSRSSEYNYDEDDYNERFNTFEEFFNDEETELETYEHKRIINDQKIVAFGYHGYNG